MSAVLVTGASGFIGSRLIRRLSPAHEVVALSRQEVAGEHKSVRGSFTSRGDLQALDAYQIDTVVHLASEIGGCSEEAGLAVNVLGTGTLLRYLVDRGCKHFVLASSIAAVGSGTVDFIPRELPIGDDHPCDAVEAYGLSKALMEEVAFYFQRQNPDLEITIFRIGLVLAEDLRRDGKTVLLTETPFPFIAGGLIAVSDVIDAFALAVDRRLGSGVRRLNLVAQAARTPVPVPEALQEVLGGRASVLDTTYYRGKGQERASLYSIERLWETYGFRPSIDISSEDGDVRG